MKKAARKLFCIFHVYKLGPEGQGLYQHSIWVDSKVSHILDIFTTINLVPFYYIRIWIVNIFLKHVE